jgi:hypothetical protein
VVARGFENGAGDTPDNDFKLSPEPVKSRSNSS